MRMTYNFYWWLTTFPFILTTFLSSCENLQLFFNPYNLSINPYNFYFFRLKTCLYTQDDEDGDDEDEGEDEDGEDEDVDDDD